MIASGQPQNGVVKGVTPTTKKVAEEWACTASHYHGRGKWGVRFNVDNAEALCYGCHQYLGANPILHSEHKLELMGEGCIDILREKANDTSLGRSAKREVKDIAKHYRAEFKRIYDLRAEGCYWENHY